MGVVLARDLRAARPREQPAPTAPRAQASGADRERREAKVRTEVFVVDPAARILDEPLRGRSPRG